MRAVILRVCHSCDPADLGAVKLNKVLYFLDMISYAHHRQAVTGATYRKRPNGPTSDQLLFMLRDMQEIGEIQVDDVDYHGFIKKNYVALVSEPVGVLTNEETTLLDDVIEFVCRRNTAKSISDYSHKLPWELAHMGDVIEYHTAMMLFPNEPSPKAFELAKEGAEELEAARSTGNAVAVTSLADFRSRLLAAAR
ncbi:Panacea domain-containing protein [Sphingopyxis granuli]|uniref:Panacea domain-containing protein n=1 Tax=Sphingopyxis granuli TaxID=267128 RepID=UPI001BAFD1C6|nr:Panacea domain-containing protein [Sphingopyxis granuli]QUM72499.1 SocA family protein [Sphingopyxis granuli]